MKLEDIILDDVDELSSIKIHRRKSEIRTYYERKEKNDRYHFLKMNRENGLK